MELAPQLGNHLTARGFLSYVHVSQQGLEFSYPPFSTLLVRHEGHVRVNRHVLLEFRTSLTPQEDHECCMAWASTRSRTASQWTFRGAQSTVAICIWRITFCCSLTRERSSRTWFHAASVSVVRPEEAHARDVPEGPMSPAWLCREGDTRRISGRVTG